MDVFLLPDLRRFIMEKAPENLELIITYFPELLPHQIEQFQSLEGLYKDWNSKINVISRKDIDSLYEKHVLHSLSIARFTGLPPGAEILDIGTGGGFPAIPLAILFSEVHFHLADSIGKKLKVVQDIAAATGLKNITTHHTRVEDIKNRKFDYAISRAVAPLKDLWQWSKFLLRKKSAGEGLASYASERVIVPPGLICLKGGDLAKEIADSGTRPAIIKIHEIFREDFFADKYIIYVPY